MTIDEILQEFYVNRKKFSTIGDRTFNATGEIYNIAKQEIQKLIDMAVAEAVKKERKRILDEDKIKHILWRELESSCIAEIRKATNILVKELSEEGE